MPFCSKCGTEIEELGTTGQGICPTCGIVVVSTSLPLDKILDIIYCINCGEEVTKEQELCPKCGKPIKLDIEKLSTKPKFPKPSKAWYLTPILLAWIGSIIGYFALKNRDKRMAKNIAILGIVFSFVWTGIILTIPTPETTTPEPAQLITPIQTIETTSPEAITQSTTTAATTTTRALQTKLSETVFYKVSEITDGDSIVLEDGSEVRLLGINAPEERYPFHEESKDYLSSLIFEKEVRLESDFEDKDRYNRLLRYVFVDDIFVNVKLVKEGWANVYMERGLKYEDQLLDAENYAKLHGLGVWEKDIAYADYIYVAEFHYDAAGNDHENLNDEYVVLGNKGDIPIDMTGWAITDEAAHRYTFPTFILKPGETVTIYSGSGDNTEKSLFWRSDNAIWNNKGDILFLRNADGELIFSHEY